jgi:hypothetical protein
MKRLTSLPRNALVPEAATERLQRKFTEAKAELERERFWAAVQRSKQPQRGIDWERDFL